MDLGTEVNPVPSSDNGRLVQVKVVKGILHSQTKLRKTKTYTIVNRNDAKRLVLVEHPVRNDFHLTDDTQQTGRDGQRRVPLRGEGSRAGKTATQAVTEEKVLNEQIHLTNSNDDQMRFFVNSADQQSEGERRPQAGGPGAAGFTEATTQRAIAEQAAWSSRTSPTIRFGCTTNLKEMPPTAAAYKRYLDKFDAQETQIEKLQEDIKKMQDTESQQKKAFEDFLNNFSAD